MRISLRMKKRLLWCAFAFVIVVLILMISTENNIIQRIPFFDVTVANGIKCYDEITITEGLRDFDPQSGTIINSAALAYREFREHSEGTS